MSIIYTKLNALTGRNFRLPTETEWEYASKAKLKPEGGIETVGYKYSGTSADLSDYAWYSVNSGGKIHAVGSKKPNDFGLYDMSGNVIEWCQDIYTNYSTGSPEIGKDERVLRGGFYGSDAASVKQRVVVVVHIIKLWNLLVLGCAYNKRVRL